MSFKKGIIYVLIANTINLLISLFSGFVLPKFLSIESYSNIKLFQLYISYIGVVSLGFADGMYLRLGGKRLENLDLEQINSEFKTYKIFQFIIMLITIICSIFIKNEMLFFCSLVILPVNISGYLKNLYQATGKFDLYSKFMNINTILIFIVNIFLLLIVKTDNYNIYIYGYIVAYFIYLLFVELETNKIISYYNTKVKSNIDYLMDDIKNGFLLMIGNFSNVVFTSIDRIFVQNLLGTVKFAFYSFAVSIENLLNVFITPVSTVMYNYLCVNKDKKQVIKIKRLMLVFATIVLLTIFPIKFIMELWLKKYLDALSILFILFAAQYISIIVRVVHINLYKSNKQQNKYFKIMLVMVFLSIILNVIFYHINKSMEMIALATFVTNITWFLTGELIFNEYKLKLKEYIYSFLIICVFLLCGMVESAILGGIIYMLCAFILILVFMNSTFKMCLDEFQKILLKFKKNI